MNVDARHPLVSVVLPCRNAGRHLDGALGSLAAQDFDLAWEVILVDNGSTDGSLALADRHAAALNLTVLQATERANASYARNVGARHARADRLLFVDADDEVDTHYVGALARALEHHPYVTSRVDYQSLNPAWIRDAHGSPWGPDDVSVFLDFMPATGTNIGVHRSVFDRAGGFPEEYSGSQDIALSWRIQLLAGSAIHFVPDAVYRYRYRATLAGLFWQTRNWGFSNTLLYKEFRKHGMPPRPFRAAAREWAQVLRDLARARNPAERAPVLARLGYCVGRAQGSLRHRVIYV